MRASRSDARLLITATAAVIAAGLLIAAVLLIASGRGGSPKRYEPFSAGLARDLRQELRDGGPFFVADPFGGNRSLLFALEDGQLVALSSTAPGTTSCAVRWKGTVDRFVDCHGDRYVSTQLDRYESDEAETGSQKGLLLVDLRHKLPAPS